MIMLCNSQIVQHLKHSIGSSECHTCRGVVFCWNPDSWHCVIHVLPCEPITATCMARVLSEQIRWRLARVSPSVLRIFQHEDWDQAHTYQTHLHSIQAQQQNCRVFLSPKRNLGVALQYSKLTALNVKPTWSCKCKS